MVYSQGRDHFGQRTAWSLFNILFELWLLWYLAQSQIHRITGFFEYHWPRFYMVVLGIVFFFFTSHLLIQYSLWIFISLFYMDFYFPFLFGHFFYILFQLFSNSFLILFHFISGGHWVKHVGEFSFFFCQNFQNCSILKSILKSLVPWGHLVGG